MLMVMVMRGMTSEHPSQPAFLQDKGLNQGIPAKKPHGADKVRNEGHQRAEVTGCLGLLAQEEQEVVDRTEEATASCRKNEKSNLEHTEPDTLGQAEKPQLWSPA